MVVKKFKVGMKYEYRCLCDVCGKEISEYACDGVSYDLCSIDCYKDLLRKLLEEAEEHARKNPDIIHTVSGMRWLPVRKT